MTIEAAQQAMREGNLPAARRHLEHVVNTNPSPPPEVRYNLAMVLARLGEFAEAANQFEHCRRLAPDNPDILNNLGNALRLSGELSKAGQVLDKALSIAPQHPPLRCNRGWLRLAQGEARDALNDFEAAIAQSADIEDAWRGKGEALLAAGKLEEAALAVDSALKKFPQSAGLHNVMGVIATRRRQPEQALSHFKRSVEQFPGDAKSLTNLGITAEQMGQLDLAEQALQQALKVRPGFHAAHFHLAHLASHQSSEAEAEAIANALLSCDSEEIRVDLEFALGKTLARLGQADKAFPHFMAARALQQKHHPFDLQSAINRLDSAGRETPGNALAAPERLFVIGMPRSGTTLVDQILASHSQVTSLGDAGTAAALEKQARAGLTSADLSDWLREQMPVEDEHGLALDTSPGQFTQLGLIASLLPEARFIHCARHPLDTCVSILEQPLTGPHGYANTLAGLGRYYRGYQELMERWSDRLGERFYTVQYEKLVAAPEEEIPLLLAHCGLPLEQACLDFHQHQRPVLTPSAAQVKQPVNTRSVGRWRRYEQFLQPLIDEIPGAVNQSP